MRTLIVVILLSLLCACTGSDCNNGIQDGNETGIDCGGNCAACVATTLETQLSGDWHLHYTVHTQLWDTVYSSMTSDCRIHLSLNEIGNGVYSAYGTVGSCAYTEAFESSWYLDEDTLLNGTMDILLLTSDSLYLEKTAQSVRYIYYR